jgi:hypothetical protein
MSKARENFSASLDPEVLAALHWIASEEDRSLQSLVDEAFADLLKKKATPRPEVTEAYLASLEKFSALYKKLAG